MELLTNHISLVLIIIAKCMYRESNMNHISLVLILISKLDVSLITCVMPIWILISILILIISS